MNFISFPITNIHLSQFIQVDSLCRTSFIYVVVVKQYCFLLHAQQNISIIYIALYLINLYEDCSLEIPSEAVKPLLALRQKSHCCNNQTPATVHANAKIHHRQQFGI